MGIVGLVHCSRDSQSSFFNKIFIKNEFHGTIYIFKNYFTIIFLIFIFQQIKQYSNTPLLSASTEPNSDQKY